MSNKLFVGNLSFNTTENDLNDAFAAFGTVTETNLMMDRMTNRPRGFGFVTMSSADEAQKAIEASGFLHKSGKILTAEHVVCNCSEIVIVPPSGSPVKATVAAKDDVLDLALLVPATPLVAPSLPISARTKLTIGTQVSTWGFPGGYLAPFRS